MPLFRKPARRFLTADPLHVSAEHLGQPLASPVRRALALAVDWSILLLPAVAVTYGAAVLSLQLSDPQVYHALRTLVREKRSDEAARAWATIAPLLVRIEAPGMPAEAIVAVEKKSPEEAARILADYSLNFSLGPEESNGEALAPKTIRIKVDRLIPRGLRPIAVFGVMALYFTLCHASRRGQTAGKRLLKIRVVHLSEERLPLLESFERFAGYLEIPATLGLALLSLWRDPNRRLPHDRVVHTAVLEVSGRGGRAGPRRGATSRKHGK